MIFVTRGVKHMLSLHPSVLVPLQPYQFVLVHALFKVMFGCTGGNDSEIKSQW